MKLVMTLLVRNEIDILEATLEYHRAQGVDFFIVTDRKSDDGTLDLLRRYEAAGLVHLIREDVDYFAQGPWVTRMAQLAYTEYGADWVINNDTDEFWWPREGTLAETLAGIDPEYGLVTVERNNFLPRPPSPLPFHASMTVRERRSLNSAGRPLPPKVLHRGRPDVEVHYGNHGVIGDQYGRTLATEAIEIFHFPMRSYEQFERKIVTGARALEANPDLPYEVGHTWRRLDALQRDGKLRAWFEERVLSEDAIERGVADGTLLIERRLADFMRGRVLPASGGTPA